MDFRFLYDSFFPLLPIVTHPYTAYEEPDLECLTYPECYVACYVLSMSCSVLCSPCFKWTSMCLCIHVLSFSCHVCCVCVSARCTALDPVPVLYNKLRNTPFQWTVDASACWDTPEGPLQRLQRYVRCDIRAQSATQSPA